ncbi:MAG: IclR family transcriptional regulator [Succinivibrio sp.]|jgi:IclR family KDG regulon transcriptional repressor|nr:IclR family transcriptional regulator [Succinivibrio sp.]
MTEKVVKTRAPAVDRCVAIMEFLQKRGQATVSEITQATGFPVSSVYVIIDAMRAHGLIRQDRRGKVQLWMKLVSLGNSAREGLDLREIVIPPLSALMDSYDCLAVHFGVMENEDAWYAVKLVPPHAGMGIRSREGMSVSLLHAGLGKCLLAFQPDALRERIISTLDYTPATPTSITNPEDLRKELSRIRLQKWAYDNSEGENDIRCVAVPVFDREGNLMGAVSIVGTIVKFTQELIPEIVKSAKSCAAAVTEAL